MNTANTPSVSLSLSSIQVSNHQRMMKPNTINKRRNKDNLWMMKQMSMNCPSMYALIFEIIDLNDYESIQEQPKKNDDDFKPRFEIDKYDNLVYKDEIYYGTYKETKKVQGNIEHQIIEIYDSSKEPKYVINTTTKKYDEVNDVFDQYMSITMEEQDQLMIIIDQELVELFSMMEGEVPSDIKEQKKIRNKLRSIIEKMYNSQIDLTTESYKKIDNFIKKLK